MSDSRWCHLTFPPVNTQLPDLKKIKIRFQLPAGVKTSREEGTGKDDEEEEVRCALLLLRLLGFVWGSFMWQRTINHFCSLTWPQQLTHTHTHTRLCWHIFKGEPFNLAKNLFSPPHTLIPSKCQIICFIQTPIYPFIIPRWGMPAPTNDSSNVHLERAQSHRQTQENKLIVQYFTKWAVVTTKVQTINHHFLRFSVLQTSVT